MALGTGWSLALEQGSEGGAFPIPVGLLPWEAPGLSPFSQPAPRPPPTGPARRSCVHRAQGQKVSCGPLTGGGVGAQRQWFAHTHLVCARETLALLGLRGWQESLGPQASWAPWHRASRDPVSTLAPPAVFPSRDLLLRPGVGRWGWVPGARLGERASVDLTVWEALADPSLFSCPQDQVALQAEETR